MTLNDSFAGSVVAPIGSVIVTTLFGSAPLSPELLEVEVVAQRVTVFVLWSTTPVRLRRPTVVTVGHGPPGPPSGPNWEVPASAPTLASIVPIRPLVST